MVIGAIKQVFSVQQNAVRQSENLFLARELGRLFAAYSNFEAQGSVRNDKGYGIDFRTQAWHPLIPQEGVKSADYAKAVEILKVVAGFSEAQKLGFVEGVEQAYVSRYPVRELIDRAKTAKNSLHAVIEYSFSNSGFRDDALQLAWQILPAEHMAVAIYLETVGIDFAGVFSNKERVAFYYEFVRTKNKDYQNRVDQVLEQMLRKNTPTELKAHIAQAKSHMPHLEGILSFWHEDLLVAKDYFKPALSELTTGSYQPLEHGFWRGLRRIGEQAVNVFAEHHFAVAGAGTLGVISGAGAAVGTGLASIASWSIEVLGFNIVRAAAMLGTSAQVARVSYNLGAASTSEGARSDLYMEQVGYYLPGAVLSIIAFWNLPSITITKEPLPVPPSTGSPPSWVTGVIDGATARNAVGLAPFLAPHAVNGAAVSGNAALALVSVTQAAPTATPVLVLIQGGLSVRAATAAAPLHISSIASSFTAYGSSARTTTAAVYSIFSTLHELKELFSSLGAVFSIKKDEPRATPYNEWDIRLHRELTFIVGQCLNLEASDPAARATIILRNEGFFPPEILANIHAMSLRYPIHQAFEMSVTKDLKLAIAYELTKRIVFVLYLLFRQPCPYGKELDWEKLSANKDDIAPYCKDLISSLSQPKLRDVLVQDSNGRFGTGILENIIAYAKGPDAIASIQKQLPNLEGLRDFKKSLEPYCKPVAYVH